MKHICKKCKRIVITKQHLSLNLIKNYNSSTNIWWYVWCWQHKRHWLRRGFKNTHKRMPRRHWCLEHSRVSSKELHNALLSHNPNVCEAFSDQQGWVFRRWFDMSTFWDNKVQQSGEKIPLFGYEAQCKGPSTHCFWHQHLLRQQKKKSRHSTSGHAYGGISDILRRKAGHIRKHLCRKRANQVVRTVLGGKTSLKIDQVGIPKDICKALTKPMVLNSLN